MIGEDVDHALTLSGSLAVVPFLLFLSTYLLLLCVSVTLCVFLETQPIW